MEHSDKHKANTDKYRTFRQVQSTQTSCALIRAADTLSGLWSDTDQGFGKKTGKHFELSCWFLRHGKRAECNNVHWLTELMIMSRHCTGHNTQEIYLFFTFKFPK